MPEFTEKIAKIVGNPFSLAGSVFLIILCVNAPQTFNPPYWDGLFGLHYQAQWLADNNFNLIRLATDEPICVDGGARAYMFSIPALFYGVLYKLLPPYIVFAVGHLVTYAMAAVTFTVFVSIIKKFTGVWLALVWCLCALLIPVFSARTAAIYQEMPLVFFSSVSIYYVAKKSYYKAILWCLLAFMAKQTGLLIALALLAWFACRYLIAKLSDKSYAEDIRWRHVALAVGLMLCFVGAVSITTDSAVPEGNEMHQVAFILERMLTHFYLFFPLLGIELILIGTAVICAALFYARKVILEKPSTPFSLFLLILIGGFWCSYSIIPIALPRYVVFSVFPMAAFLAINLPRKLSIGVACFILVFAVINQNGMLLPALKPNVRRSGAYLERSREFLTDLEANRVICSTLEENNFNDPIVAQYFFVQMLTIPRMGYVRHALPNVYYPGNIPIHSTTKKVEALADIPANALYIYAPTNYLVFFMPAEGDTVVYMDESLPGRIYIYRRKKVE